MAAASPLPRVAAFFDHAALWIAVAIGFSIPISTALDNLLVAALVLCWVGGGRYGEKIAAIRGNIYAILACALFLLYLVGSLYSMGDAAEVVHALDKALVLLLIPVLISLSPAQEIRDRARYAFMAAVLLTLVLSYLLWLGFLPEGQFIKGAPSDPVIFKLRVTHGVLMAFGAFLFAFKARVATDLRWRLVWALGAALAASNILFMVQGRTGQLVLMTLLLYFVISSFRWRGLLATVAAGLAIGGTVYLTPSSSLHQRTLTTIDEIQDWQAGMPPTLANMRLEAWSNGLNIVRENPLFGVGTGGFFAAYVKQVEGTSMFAVRQPENQYLLTTVELGVVGLAALLALFAMQWHLASRLAARSDIDFARGLVITMAVGCMFNSFLLDHTEALFYAWLSGVLYAGLRPAGERT